MARFRISGPAQADIADILQLSGARWGTDARRRYADLLATAFRRIAADLEGRLTVDRRALAAGVRSLALRVVERGAVKAPAHVVYYRVAEVGLVEVLRVLHRRMDPARHIGKR